MVEWWGLYTGSVGGVGSIPDWGAKIPCAMQPRQKIKKFNIQQPTAFLSTSNEHMEFDIKIDIIYFVCTQTCLTLCDLMDHSLPGNVHLQKTQSS